MPTTASLLRPTVNHSSVDSLQLKRQKATFYHVRHILELSELEIGPKVRVAPLRKNQTWKQGTCTEKLSDIIRSSVGWHEIKKKQEVSETCKGTVSTSKARFQP